VGVFVIYVFAETDTPGVLLVTNIVEYIIIGERATGPVTLKEVSLI
jgi:hypothetical protein